METKEQSVKTLTYKDLMRDHLNTHIIKYFFVLVGGFAIFFGLPPRERLIIGTVVMTLIAWIILDLLRILIRLIKEGKIVEDD